MKELLCRGTLWGMTSFLILYFENIEASTAYILCGFILCSIGYFADHPLDTSLLTGIVLFGSLLFPPLGFLCILTAFELSYKMRTAFAVNLILEQLGILLTLAHFFVNNYILILLYLFLCIMAFLAGSLLRQLETVQQELIHSRDESVEKQELLQQKYKTLREKQDNELRMATLKERNRIAREIHDHIGHGLSRSLIQLGAIMTINKNTDFEKQLHPLKLTLDEAMTNIRNSVHDLHNESIDFSISLQQLLDEMNDYEVILKCDISNDISQNTAYCLLAIIKEAFTNIQKHSDATTIEVYAQELSDFYRLVIEDNGTSKKGLHINNGIGLKNMENRIQELHGMIHFSNEKGFRIFASIPKTN